jgi:2-polyprenyl-3-methyl-5-hydroxy-6-metoxy-1,4-benzoquinol methylase
MERVPEPQELMSDVEQAQAYGSADLTRFNGALIDEFQRHCADFTGGRVLDLGCGAADIAIRFARAYPLTTVVGIDGSEAMLELARQGVEGSQLNGRIELRAGYIPEARLEEDAYDAVVANSFLHHLSDPSVLWSTISLCARPGAAVMVVDLIRPQDAEQAMRLVEEYAGRGRPVVKKDLFNSLCAAYTVDEIEDQLRVAGMEWMHVKAVSELQLMVLGFAKAR